MTKDERVVEEEGEEEAELQETRIGKKNCRANIDGEKKGEMKNDKEQEEE